MNIPYEILEKYNMKSLDGYKEDFGESVDTEKMFYETFLKQTDYICNKIVEGVSTREDYADELNYRQFARDEINRLSK